LAFPKGNDTKSDHLSLYLDVAESESLPCGWRRHAQFSFTIVNHIPEKCSQRKGEYFHASHNIYYCLLVDIFCGSLGAARF